MKLNILNRGVRVRVSEGVYFSTHPSQFVVEVDDELGKFLSSLSAYSEIVEVEDEEDENHDKVDTSETLALTASSTTLTPEVVPDVVNLLSDFINRGK